MKPLILFLSICFLFPGFLARQSPQTQPSDLKNDISLAKTIAIVELTEGFLPGLWPVTREGLELKKELDLPVRVHTRACLNLKGRVIQTLKGIHPDNINFQIAMSNLTIDRDNNVLDGAGSNIPDLIIGHSYLILTDENNALIWNDIFEADSKNIKIISDLYNPPHTQVPSLITIKYTTEPFGTFKIIGSDIKDVTLENLTDVLKKYQNEHPNSVYELLAEVKSVSETIEQIKRVIQKAGIVLQHYWVPTSEISESPHGPGFVDLLKNDLYP